MESKILGIRKCDNCGNIIEIKHKNRLNSEFVFCCRKCHSEHIKSKAILNVECSFCGKRFHLKPYSANKHKKHYCSDDCNKKDRSIYMSGEGNHQFGKLGKLNDGWKSDIKITNYGYIKIRKLEHPFKDCDGFVFEHRLIAEKYLLDENNSIEVNGSLYLKKEYCVHHIDENKKNNNLNNLKVMNNSEHMSLHKNKNKSKNNTTKIKYEPIYKKCKWCDKEFKVSKSQKDIRNCCSVECSNKLNNRGTSIVVCNNCGENFKIKNSVLNKSENSYCSRECYYEYRRNSSTNI